jgi:hypothetical protein
MLPSSEVGTSHIERGLHRRTAEAGVQRNERGLRAARKGTSRFDRAGFAGGSDVAAPGSVGSV